jgi:cytochrome P450
MSAPAPLPGSADRLFDLDQEVLRCPHEAFRELQERPVQFVDRIGAYVVSRYEDVRQVLRDVETYSSRNPTGPHSATSLANAIVAGERFAEDFPEREELLRYARRRAEIGSARVLISADAPQHGIQRALVRPAFAPRRIAGLEPQVRQIAEELVDRIVGAPEVELVSAFCRPLPMLVIADALGVAREDREDFERWSDAFVIGVGNTDKSPRHALEMLREINQFYDYFSALIDDRQATPRDDLVSDITHARLKDGTELSYHEKLQILSNLLVAGNETTASLLSSAMLELAEDPGRLEALRADTGAIPDFLEEVLRAQAPSSGLYRVVTRDTVLGGEQLPAGSYVFVSFHAANHDPDQFPEPEQLCPERPATRSHLAFGNGPHLCLGAPLARLEARVGLETLLARLGEFSLVGSRDELSYFPSFAIRGVTALPLRLSTGTA